MKYVRANVSVCVHKDEQIKGSRNAPVKKAQFSGLGASLLLT